MANVKQLMVSFVTPDRQVSHGEVDMVVAPSAMGQVGILPDHCTLLADLAPGIVELHSKNNTLNERFAISGGFLEVDRNHVSLLVETAERANEIDVERARKSLKASEAALANLSTTSDDYQNQFNRAQRARVRLQVAGKL
ncbi:MAG: ATP synthase F1 subunit epsilon [Deltaproteobacteria bacterium]|nr:ATP synthase F1 subunit epsilon [Deltaproteobacteria bacterium]